MDQASATNIFFVLTSVAVVTVTILLCVILYFLARILRDVAEVTRRLRGGADSLSDDLASIRLALRRGLHGLKERAVKGARSMGVIPPKGRGKNARARPPDDERAGRV
jgi:hypothetical protein